MIQNIFFFLLLVSVAVQLGYAAYYFIPFIFYKPPVLPFADFPVSVIIAAHNEHDNLRQFLPRILQQAYKVFEVIVVDDRSTDDTQKYLSELRQHHVHLRIITIERTPPEFSPKKYALSQGIAAARYEHLLFTDADCKPFSSNWINNMASGFYTDTAIVLGYAPYTSIYGILNKLIRFETLITAIQYFSFAIRGSSYLGVGRNLAYTKTCFNSTNGFDAHNKILGGDDDLFIRDAKEKNKVNIVLSKESQTLSIPKQTYSEWVIQKRRHMAVGRQYKMADQLRIGIFMLANIFFYLSLLILLFVETNLFRAGILFGLRSIVIFAVYKIISQKLKESLSVTLLPLLDLAYFFNYLVLGVSVLMYNKVRWK